jgi:alkaline phosphatase D
MKIAVASCTKLQQINPQPVWLEILNEKPDVLVLAGDNIYLEHDHHDDPELLRAELDVLYKKQFAEPNFKSLLSDIRDRNAKLLAVYDDHDFLGNNRYGGDSSPALRDAARAAFVHAFGADVDGSNIYRKLSAGPADIFLLDERYYRTEPATSAHDRDAILGAQQWDWLEKGLAASRANFAVVVSSTTFHRFGDESWEQYPTAFGRMRGLLQGRQGAMIVSGDVHRNALYDDSGVIEVVSSGVARKGLVFGAPRKNYGILTFTEAAVNIELRGLKAGDRYNATIARSNWRLDQASDLYNG